MEGLEKVKGKLASGELVLGTHVSLADSCVTELLGDVGFDLLWIDTEHSPLDKSGLVLHLVAARAAGAAAFVRVPWNDPVLAKPVLEMGVDGIIFPMIRTEEEARRAVSACLYPPEGIRGFGPRRAARYGLVGGADYLRAAASGFWRILQIEHHQAVDNLDAILSVPGVDSIVVGPNDLSGSVGLLGQTGHPRVTELMDRIVETAHRRKVPVGTSIPEDPATIQQWIDRGVQWLVTGSDTSYLANGARSLFRTVRGMKRGGRP
ncbi:MAG TPA: aldolase/citrate lyase family protein [Spirochaetia bacterium]|nr:aldolase/citrate lyase family protein [Spirochaetia bacterium]